MSGELQIERPDPSAAARAPRWLVACLCAAWCGTCRDYREVVRAAAARFPADDFLWLDIEDHADWVDDLDIETFPCVLVLDRDQILFYGPVLPGGEALGRLLQALDINGAQPVQLDDEVQALATRLRDGTSSWAGMGSGTTPTTAAGSRTPDGLEGRR